MADDVEETMDHDEEETEEPKASKRKRSGPKGMYVSLPIGVRTIIDERCKESFRSPDQEVAWIVREWIRDNAADAPDTAPGEEVE